MHSFTVWKLADEPNYSTNIDQVFPYSELPHQGEYKLVKIPISLNNLIQHVDYWGEGRVVCGEGISGFPNCLNVNHQYRLVSSGPDRDKKIPNRIPVLTYTDCDTSAYIKDNSVLTVTVAEARITSSCVKDIARIVNNDHGKVVVYGDSQEISELAVALKKKGLFPYHDATLPSELQGLTYYDSHVAFLNHNDIVALKETLYNNVVNGNYESAVNLSRSFVTASVGEAIKEIVNRLISSVPRNVVMYAYKLWHGGAKDVVRNHFPKPFQHILNEDAVVIVNKIYNQALLPPLWSFDSKNNNGYTAIRGSEAFLRTSERRSCKFLPLSRFSWKFLPRCNRDKLTFILHNVNGNMFMRMDDDVDYAGDRQCWGATMNEEDLANDRYKYYLEPVIGDNGNVVFIIINVQHQQGLKLEVKKNVVGDRLLWGHNGNIHDANDRFRWVVVAIQRKCLKGSRNGNRCQK